MHAAAGGVGHVAVSVGRARSTPCSTLLVARPWRCLPNVRDRSRHISIVDTKVLDQGGKYVFVKPNHEQLDWLAQLAAAGTLRVKVQQTLPLEQAREAHRMLEADQVRGKLVLTVA